MLEQTLDGRPIIIRKAGSEYMVYYDHDIYFLNERPITDQDRSNLRAQLNGTMGQTLGNVLVQLLQQATIQQVTNQ